MRVVTLELEIVEGEIEEALHIRIDMQHRQGSRLARELLVRLLQMIEIEMSVAECVDELARLKPRHLCHHHGEERIGSDVERHTEKNVRTSLI